MKAAEVLLCLHLSTAAYAADKPRPRGVSPEFAKFYKDATTFTCISFPSIQLPVSRLNDDYCDCPDGSDEPGTSACAHLSPLSPQNPGGALVTSNNTSSNALPGFYCKNNGHNPAYVPFVSVNDGRCDYDLCCDGSEEWSGLVKCEDRCGQIGKEWRKADEARKTSLNNAARKRRELVAEAAALRQEVEDRVQTLKTEIEGGERKVKQLEQELAEVERKEKGKMVRGGQGGGKLGVLVGLAQQRVNELRNALVRVREERDESWNRLQELEAIMTTFKEEYNPNFNDEGVKRAVRAWEDYAAQDRPGVDHERDGDLDSITGADKMNGLDWDEFQNEGQSDTDVLYSFENYLPPTLRTWLDQKLRDLRVTLIDAGILAQSSDSAGESKVITAARDRLTSAKDDLEKSQTSLTKHQKDLDDDFGPDGVFRALKGDCVSVESGEYTYEVCFMDATTQKPKKGGGNVNMGRFTTFETVTVDDVLPPDGRGLGSGERLALRFENGQHCWNGPHRSTLVVLACAEEPAIWKVMEEEKCVYRMEVGTPAVCEAPNGSAKKADGGEAKRDEL